MTYAEAYAREHQLTDGFAPSIDAALALQLRDAYGIRVFVETGIWHGGTTQWAVQNFEWVWACELDPLLARHAHNRFSEYANLSLATSDSRPFLKALLRHLTEPALIYLDAHYIADKHSAGDPADCPLIGELGIITNCPFLHVVVIDDARLIVGRDPDYLVWPTLEEVKAAIPYYDVQHIGKALVCIPKAWL